MTKEKLYEGINMCIHNIACLPLDKINDNDILINAGIDDLDLIEIVMDIEKGSGILIEDHFSKISVYENTILDFKKFVLGNVSGIDYETDYVAGEVRIKVSENIIKDSE